jgi:hypothetical protein
VRQLKLPPKLDERALAGRLAAAGAALLALAVIVTTVADRAPRRAPAMRAIPALVVADNVDGLAAGYGSVWTADPTAGRIVRIDARRRAVVARIRAPGVTSVSTGLGAVWANAHGALLKIDPRTDRVLARVPVETPDGFPYKTFDVFPTPGGVWLVQARQALRLDPDTLELRGSTPLADHGAEATAWSAAPNGLWTVTALPSVQRYDWRTGARVASLRSPVAAPTAIVATRHAVVVLNASGDAARIDARTGRVAWRAHLPARVGAAGADRRFLLTKGADPTGPRDLLLKTDLADGRLVARLAMTELGSEGRIQFTGHEAWMTVFGGKVVGARP